MTAGPRPVRAAVPLPAKAFAAIGWVAAVVGGIAAVTLRVLDPVPVVASPFGFGDVALVGFEVMGVAFASVGALLVVRRHRNAVGWCMVLIGIGYADGGLAAAATCSVVAHATDGGRLAGVIGWLALVLTTLGGLVFILPFIFPTGRGHTPAWDRLIRFSMIPMALGFLVLAFQPGPLHIFSTIVNPFGVLPDLRTIVGFSFSQMISVGAFGFAPFVVLAVVLRYRSTDYFERQQIKWFLVASLVSILGVLSAAGGAALSREPSGEAGLAVFGFAGALVPVAIGIAILRHHLYDIDRLISRTLGYAVMTGALGAVFVGVILLLSGVLARFAEGQTIAIASSTLVVFTLFQPARRRIQRAVDRRFDRARYDADRTIESLAGRLRDDLDLATVSLEIIRTADAAVRPASISVWLRGSPRS
jgi:hypothetical protein